MNYLFLAGIGNSEPEHWQALWHRRLGGHWVEHDSWEHPRRTNWVEDLEREIQPLQGPTLLVCHSLGCLLAFEWAKQFSNPSPLGAFLVSVPDVEGQNFPKQIEGFKPALQFRPPFACFLVASRNDPYSSFEHCEKLARFLGVKLGDVGEKGHINLKSNLGYWEEGLGLLKDFEAGLQKQWSPKRP
jgi:predicted alpha/beta hydrolase family esterase